MGGGKVRGMRTTLPALAIGTSLLAACSQDWSNARNDKELEMDASAASATDAAVPDSAASTEATDPPDGAVTGCTGVCEPGSAIACTTSCGSRGTATCTQECAAPAVDKCLAPAESCNWTDDDCDGVVDEGLLTAQPSRAQVWTQAGDVVRTDQAANLTAVALLPRADGAWFLYRSAPLLANALVQEASIEARLLDRGGKLVRKLVMPATATTGNFIASVAGEYVVLLVQQLPTPNNDSQTKKLQLFRLSDLSLVSEYSLASVIDDDTQRGDRNDANDCTGYLLNRVLSFVDDEGNVRIALMHGVNTPVAGGATACSTLAATHELSTITFKRDGSWSAPKRVAAVKNAMTRDTQLVRLPCRNEWLAWYTPDAPAVWSSVRFDGDGNTTSLNVDTNTATIGTLLDLQANQADCSAAEHDLILGYSAKTAAMTDPAYTYLRRYTLSKSGALTAAQGGDVRVPASLVHLQGAVLESGRVLLFGVSEELKLVLIEGTRELANLRRVEMDTLTSEAATAVYLQSGPGAYNLVSFAHTGESLMVAISKLLGSTKLDEHRAAGDADPAVAATYSFGCP